MPPPDAIFVSPTAPLVLCVAHDTHRAGFSVGGRNAQWFMGLALSGGFQYSGEDGSLLLAAGELLLVRPGVYHRWVAADAAVPGADAVPGRDAASGRAPGAAAIMWATFQPRPHWGEYLQGPEALPGFIRYTLTPDGFRRARRGMQLALRSFYWSGVHHEKWAMLSLERVLLGLYDDSHRVGSMDLHVRRALDFIHRNIGRQLSLEEIAASACISVSFLIRLFRRQVGMTPISYVEQLRLQRATDLLRNSQYPVAQIATLLGYEHPSYFGRRFLKATGLTPRAYRQSVTPAATEQKGNPAARGLSGPGRSEGGLGMEECLKP